MTDRINALLVTLDRPIRSDDIESLRQAIMQFRGVADVSLNVEDMDSHIAITTARSDIQERLWKALFEEPVQ